MPVCVSVISVASRASKLAKRQVVEVLQEMRVHYPEMEFDLTPVETYGDKDRSTSLKTLEAGDFFTREVDTLVVSGQCRIGIHSAKDLPEPLDGALEIVALTQGLNSGDSLVLRFGESLESLPQGAKIATSSFRREEAVKSLRSGLVFVDTRGSVEERLAALALGQADGVVVAEAALIRLDLIDLNRIALPGPTAKHQGQLAVVALKGDTEMRELFSKIDTR